MSAVPDLVGPAEAAEILGVTSGRVSQLRHDPSFARPVAVLAAGPVWARADVETCRSPHPSQHPPLDLAATTEGADLFDVESGRFGHIARLPGFPAPIATLKLGRVWARSDLMDFLARWPRTPGRPKNR